MPGSGKTFYQKKILKRLGKKVFYNDYTFLSKTMKFFFIILFMIRYTSFFFSTLTIIRKLKTLNQINRYLYYFYNEIALRAHFDQNRKPYFVNSEGFFYRSSLYFQNNFNIDVIKHLKKIPTINILVVVKSSKKINLRRVHIRKNQYKYSMKDLINYKKKKIFLEKISSFYKKNLNKLLIIDNSDYKHTNNNIDKIIKCINSL